MMTAKEQLELYQSLVNFIEDLKSLRQMYLTLATKTTPTLSSEPKGVGGNSRKVEMFGIKIAEVDEKIEQLINQYSEEMMSTIELINQLPEGLERRVLHHRYILCETPKETAKALNYSESYIYIIQKRGLEKLSQL